MTWRIAVFAYLLCGAAFVLWHSRAWLSETERHWKRTREEEGWPLWLTATVCLASLVADVVFWPRSACIAVVNWRKRRRWEAHGDFCHCDECDSDE